MEEKNLNVNIKETPPVFVLGDKNMLIRIIENLLNNCAKHSLGDIDIKIEFLQNAKITFTNPINQDTNINVDKLFCKDILIVSTSLVILDNISP